MKLPLWPGLRLRSSARQMAWSAAVGSCIFIGSCGGGDPEDQQQQSQEADGRKQAMAMAAPAGAKWSAPVLLQTVPAAAANLPNGKVIMWSSYSPWTFGMAGQTYTVLYDPLTQTATQTVVANTGHDMFCPGTTNLADGRLLVNGGDDSTKTSIYNAFTNSWSTGAAMTMGRGYQSNCLLQDGSVLTYGGSWSGGRGRKNAEMWTESGGWRALPGVPVGPAIGPDPGGIYRADNHTWLFPSPNGQVFHAGPSVTMNWIDTQGNGQIVPAGLRGDDSYSQNGNAVMYDIGKILKTGGSSAYEGAPGNSSAYVIDMNTAVSVRKVGSMAYPRVYASAVALPNGQVMVVGGQVFGKLFSDDGSVLVPELWDPVTETFTALPPMAVGRNYHSFAMLLPDARVLVGGGGLCGEGCAANHADVQTFTPHYLLDQQGNLAPRPVITNAPVTASHGTNITVTTDSAVTSFALVRIGSVTHTVNNDQRRIPLPFTTTGSNVYSLTIPSNPSVALPGYYMLFANSATGVPSVSKSVQIIGTAAPKLGNPGPKAGNKGVAVQLAVNATASNGSLAYSAEGLPAGLAINSSSGLISGSPTTSGTFYVTVSARDSSATTSTQFQWTVTDPGSTLTRRYVKLEALTGQQASALTSIAEFNLLSPSGIALSRAGWAVVGDSEDEWGVSEAGRAIDGDDSTYWLTQSAPDLALPHTLVVDMGSTRTLGGFMMMPRAAGGAGAIANWRLHTSPDGINWTVAATGTFAATSSEKIVMFDGSAGPTNQPPMIGIIANRTNVSGQTLTMALSATDSDGDPLTYAAAGLPTGMTMNAATGVISGTLSAAGTFNVTVTVTDGRGGSANRAFTWTIAQAVAGAVRYVRLEAVSEINGSPWTSMAEFNVLDGSGTVIPRTGWSATADSSETAAEIATPEKAIDGDIYSIWHTAWSGASNPLPPHTFTVNMGAPRVVGGFKYLPRPGGGPGTIASWKFYTSVDGISWNLVGQDTFANATSANEKTAYVGGSGVNSGNRPPVLPAIADRVNAVGNSLSLTLGASDPDGNTLSYIATGLPGGMTINPTTGTISGTLTTAGTFTVNVLVADPFGGSASRTFSWLVTSPAATTSAQYVRLEAVTEINGNPWTSMAEFNVLDGNGAVLARTGWTATADSSETIGETATPNLAIDGDPYSIWHTRWSGGVNPPTPHTFTVNMGTTRSVGGFKYLPRSGGGNGTIASWRFYTSANGTTWSLVGQGTFANTATEKTALIGGAAAINQPPVLVAIEDRSDVVGSNVSLPLVASDADGDALTYSATGLPAGIAINATTGAISGSPTAASNQDVVVQVIDNKGGVASRTFSWTITSAGAAITGPVQYVRLEALSGINGHPWTSMAEFNLIDATGANISRAGWVATADSAEVVAESAPASAAIDGNAGTFWHTQYQGAVTPLPHTFTVNLGTARTPRGFKYLPRPGGAGNTGGFGSIADWRFYSSTNGTTWTLVAQGTFSPAYAEKTVLFPVAPAANSAPVIGAVANQITASGTVAYLPLTATDADGDALTWSASGLPTGITINAASGEIGGMPTVAATSNVTVTVSDGKGGTATRTFTWTVTAPTVNQPPVLAVIADRSDVVSTAAVAVNVQASDPNGDTLTFSATGLPPGVSISPANGQIQGILTTAGVSNVTVTANDGKGGVASRTFKWTITAANQLPVLAAVANRSDVTGTPVAVALQATDADGNALTYAASGLPAGIAINAASGVMSGTPTTVAVSTVIINVSDGKGGTAARTFIWTVTAPIVVPVNQPPVMVAVANRSDTVGQAVSLALQATDADGNALTFVATGLPAGLGVNATTGLISGTPTTAGVSNVTATVSDGKGGTASRAFTWTVTAAPVNNLSARYVRLEAVSELWGNPWTSMAEFNVLDAAGNALSRLGWTVVADSAEVTGENGAAANAIDGDTNTIWHTAWLGGSPTPPHTLTVNMGDTRTIGGFKYLPRPGGGNGTIAGWRLYTSPDGSSWVQVGQGTFANTAAEKTVYPLGSATANQIPVLPAIAAQSGRVSQAVSLPLAGSDPDGDTLTWTATGLPAGLTINATTGVISGLPTAIGTSTVTVTVADGRGAFASQSFSMGITAATAGTAVQYVRLEAVSEINGRPWTSMAEFNLLDRAGALIPRTGWTVLADSAEVVAEFAPAAAAIDGNVNTFWHTQYQGVVPPTPHIFTVNLGTPRPIGGFRYLPRAGGDNGTGGFGSIGGWRFYTSADGVAWTMVSQGTFPAAYGEKTVTLP